MLNTLAIVFFGAGIGVSYAVSAVSDAVSPFVKRNYEHNSSCVFGGFVHDQTAGTASKLKIGYMRASFNGCGCFAAYNALLLRGISVPPADIIKYYESHGGIVLDGVLGVNPLAVRGLLRSLGLNAVMCNFPRKTDKLIAEAGVCVLTYLHRRGMHFVAVEFAGGEYRIYNAYIGDSKPYCVASVDEWLKNTANRFVAVSVIQVFS